MITHKINFANLARQLTPPFRRTAVRLSLLGSLIKPLQWLFDNFDSWRQTIRMELRVNSQVAVLEGYLSKKHNAKVAIKIVTYDDGALEIALSQEGDTLSVDIATSEEQSPFVQVPLSGEVRNKFGDSNFIIYTPAEVDIEALRADVERFRTAGTRFRIVAQYYVTLDDGTRLTDDNGEHITITKQ